MSTLHNRFDWSVYRGNLKWLPNRTIFLTQHGSKAYGTSTPTSDDDYKGVCIPPKEYFLGWLQNFEQAEVREPVDMVVYDMRKFCNLAADCNPNIIEVLHTHESDHFVVTPLGRELLDAKDDFLSRKARHTFSGYAFAQLKRIQTHHRWLRNPPKAPPTRTEFGLAEMPTYPENQRMAAESMMRKQVDSWLNPGDLSGVDPSTIIAVRNAFTDALVDLQLAQETVWRAAGQKLGFDSNFLDVVERERRYHSAKDEWKAFLTWQKERNPARHALEEKWGYDTKHGMHLVRLMRMCEEILSGKGVLVKRPDAQELLAIRNGALPYDDLLQWAKDAEARLKVLDETSLLPKSPNRVKLDKLCVRLVECALAGES